MWLEIQTRGEVSFLGLGGTFRLQPLGVPDRLYRLTQSVEELWAR